MVGPRRHLRGVVRQVRDPVERRIVAGEVHPALRAGARIGDTDADEQALGVHEAGDRVGHVAGHVRQDLHQLLQGHRGDQRVVGSGAAVGEGHLLATRIDRDDALVELHRPRQRLGDPLVEHPGAEQRELELVVRPPAHVIAVGELVLQDPAEVDLGDPVALPRRAHLVQRRRPDLEVVREHEVLGDARAEHGRDPLLEVRLGERGTLRLDDPHHAIDVRLGWQSVDVVLERVRHEPAVDPHPRLTHVLVVVTVQHLLDELVEVRVVAEHHMAAVVPDEPVGIVVAPRQAPHVVGGFVHIPVGMAELAEAVGGAKTGGSGAEDHDASAHLAAPASSALPASALRVVYTRCSRSMFQSKLRRVPRRMPRK